MKSSRAMWWLKQEGKVYWFVAFIAIVVMVSLGYAGHKHKSTKGASEYIGVVLDSAVVPMSNYKVDANVHVYGYSIIEGCEYILIGNPLKGLTWTHKGDCKNPKHRLVFRKVDSPFFCLM